MQMQVRFYHQQLLSGHLSDRTLRKIWPALCYPDDKLQPHTGFEGHVLISTLIVFDLYMCVCVGGGGGNVFISSHDFQVFEILKRITCDCREQKGQSWKKQAKLWWNDWRAWQATKQRREERQTHKRGELKLTVCTWCVPEDPWFTHTSCQSAAGFWICGLELDWMVWGGSHDTRRTWCRWVPKRKAAPCWACLCSTTPEVFRRSSLPHYEMVLKEKHVRHRWKFRRLCFQLSSDFTGGK